MSWEREEQILTAYLCSPWGVLMLAYLPFERSVCVSKWSNIWLVLWKSDSFTAVLLEAGRVHVKKRCACSGSCTFPKVSPTGSCWRLDWPFVLLKQLYFYSLSRSLFFHATVNIFLRTKIRTWNQIQVCTTSFNNTVQIYWHNFFSWSFSLWFVSFDLVKLCSTSNSLT